MFADMNYIGIFETAYNMQQGISIADRSQELISKAFTLAGSFYKTGDVQKLNGCFDYLFTPTSSANLSKR